MFGEQAGRRDVAPHGRQALCRCLLLVAPQAVVCPQGVAGRTQHGVEQLPSIGGLHGAGRRNLKQVGLLRTNSRSTNSTNSRSLQHITDAY